MSKPYISLMLACRVKGNNNSNLYRCLQGFAEKAGDSDLFEVLIKFDDDDENARAVIEQISALKLNLKTIITPRGKGYADLHKAYYDLYLMASASSQLFWVISDDMEILSDGWDGILQNAYLEAGERTSVLHAKKLIDLSKLDYLLSADKVDPYPIWTRKWLCSAGFGYSFSTDGWTGIIEYLLFSKYDIDNRVVVKNLKHLRHKDSDIDGPNSPRWNNERRILFEMIESENFIQIVNETAATVSAKIQQEGKKKIDSARVAKQFLFKRIKNALSKAA